MYRVVSYIVRIIYIRLKQVPRATRDPSNVLKKDNFNDYIAVKNDILNIIDNL